MLIAQRLKGFTETDGSRFHIGVGEYKMIDQVGKGLTGNRDAKLFHMGKIGLGSFTWGMDLFKDDVLFWSLQQFPPGNMPTQRAVLRRTIPVWMLFAQQGKERGG